MAPTLDPVAREGGAVERRRDPEVQPVGITRSGQGGVPLGTLQALSVAVSRAPELAGGLNGVLDALLGLTGAHLGAIHLYQEETGELFLVASRGLSERFRTAECRIPFGACVCGRAIADDEPVVIEDLSTSASTMDRPACVEERVRALVAVPCRSRGKTYGLLALYSEAPWAFSGIDRTLLRAIGVHLGAAIDNAEWTAVNREQAVSAERHVLAAELHDGVAQTLAYLNLQIARVQDLLAHGSSAGAERELASVRAGIQSAYEDVRRLLSDFRLSHVDGAPFSDALRRQADAFGKRSGVRVTVRGEEHVAGLSFTQQAELLRIVQEALANVQKHAAASTVGVVCERRGADCLVRVIDDGVGFDTGTISEAGATHVGTSLMRERAARIDGAVTFESRPGSGTTVIVSVPLLFSEERRVS